MVSGDKNFEALVLATRAMNEVSSPSHYVRTRHDGAAGIYAEVNALEALEEGYGHAIPTQLKLV